MKNLIITTLILFLSNILYAGGPGSGRHKETFSTMDTTVLIALIVITIIASLFIIIGVYIYNYKQNKRRIEIDRLNKEEKEKQKRKIYEILSKFTMDDSDLIFMESHITHELYSVNEYNKMAESLLKKYFLIEKYGVDLGVSLFQEKYFIGMTEEQLIDSKGNPTKIETEKLKTKTKNIFIYGNKNSGDVFNFVDGKLERFKDR